MFKGQNWALQRKRKHGSTVHFGMDETEVTDVASKALS